jgi:hypothetical protein
MLWRISQPAQHRLAGIINGRPVVTDMDVHTLVALAPDQPCWVVDVDVSRDIVVTVCLDADTTTVSQYRLPGE